MSAPGELLMPKLGLTMEEGRVARWAVGPGARFAAGEVIVVIETDKIANEVEAPAAGEMLEHLAPEGSVLPVSAPIARWRLDGTAPTTPQPPETGDVSLRVGGGRPAPPGGGGPASRRVSTADEPSRPRTLEFRILATPYARRLARENGVDLGAIRGTGANGRIKAEDVLRAVPRVHVPPPLAVPLPSPGASVDGSDRVPTGHGRAGAPAATVGETHAPGRGRALSLAQIEVDMRRLREIERSLSSESGEPFRLALVAMAAARALDVMRRGELGLEASSAGATRCLPLDLDARTGLRAVSAVLAQARATAGGGPGAATGTLLIAQGSELTLQFAPAPPPGWAAALGLGAEREMLRRRPDGAIAESHAMALALSYDAAALGNAAALAFLARLKQLLEEPLAMLAG